MILSRLVILGLLAAVLLPDSGMAQTRPSSTVAENSSPLIMHLRNQLRAPEARQRELALVDVIALANCNTSCTLGLHSLQNNKKLRVDDATGAASVLDLNALVPDVRRIYRRESPESHKLLALSALINIGNEEALESLIEKPSNSAASQVGRQTNRSIASFFLEKYPELKRQTERTGHLSLTDVRRVRAVHLKQSEIAENN